MTLVLIVGLLGTSCGYSLAGRGTFLPASIQVIGVPQLANASPYFGVEQPFTEKIRSEFIGRGRYRVLPQEAGVDAVLRGSILSIAIQPSNFNAQQQATRYLVTITTKIEFFDLQANKVLWENSSMVVREEYDLPPDVQAADPQVFLGSAANALDRISTEFARTVVSAILEAF
ncbi:MAG: LPS assembly lipoprotein LptE [Acidobacteriota bacterium]